jgi:hypothetical protein
LRDVDILMVLEVRSVQAYPIRANVDCRYASRIIFWRFKLQLPSDRASTRAAEGAEIANGASNRATEGADEAAEKIDRAHIFNEARKEMMATD